MKFFTVALLTFLTHASAISNGHRRVQRCPPPPGPPPPPLPDGRPWIWFCKPPSQSWSEQHHGYGSGYSKDDDDDGHWEDDDGRWEDDDGHWEVDDDDNEWSGDSHIEIETDVTEWVGDAHGDVETDDTKWSGDAHVEAWSGDAHDDVETGDTDKWPGDAHDDTEKKDDWVGDGHDKSVDSDDEEWGDEDDGHVETDDGWNGDGFQGSAKLALEGDEEVDTWGDDITADRQPAISSQEQESEYESVPIGAISAAIAAACVAGMIAFVAARKLQKEEDYFVNVDADDKDSILMSVATTETPPEARMATDDDIEIDVTFYGDRQYQDSNGNHTQELTYEDLYPNSNLSTVNEDM
eukprot:scaffold2638_cov66-Cyclotella_meneghiniana.AAC.10